MRGVFASSGDRHDARRGRRRARTTRWRGRRPRPGALSRFARSPSRSVGTRTKRSRPKRRGDDAMEGRFENCLCLRDDVVSRVGCRHLGQRRADPLGQVDLCARRYRERPGAIRLPPRLRHRVAAGRADRRTNRTGTRGRRDARGIVGGRGDTLTDGRRNRGVICDKSATASVRMAVLTAKRCKCAPIGVDMIHH